MSRRRTSEGDPTNIGIGRLVRALRQRRHLSQATLAASMPNWHMTTLAKIEAGDRALKAVEIFPLARALGCQPVELLDGTEIRAQIRREIDRLDSHLVKLEAERKALEQML